MDLIRTHARECHLICTQLLATQIVTRSHVPPCKHLPSRACRAPHIRRATVMCTPSSSSTSQALWIQAPVKSSSNQRYPVFGITPTMLKATSLSRLLIKPRHEPVSREYSPGLATLRISSTLSSFLTFAHPKILLSMLQWVNFRRRWTSRALSTMTVS